MTSNEVAMPLKINHADSSPGHQRPASLDPSHDSAAKTALEVELQSFDEKLLVALARAPALAGSLKPKSCLSCWNLSYIVLLSPGFWASIRHDALVQCAVAVRSEGRYCPAADDASQIRD